MGLVVALVIVSVNKSDDSPNSSISSCAQTFTFKAKYTRSKDLYRDLSKDELLQVRDYILNVPSLNLTAYEEATVNSNYIFLIELQNPIKDEAIAYLDHNGKKPTRAANVVIFKGAATPPIIEEILVYFDTPMRHKPNTLLTDRTIPIHARPFNKRSEAIFVDIVNKFGEKAHQILNESFGGYVITNCTTCCLTFLVTGPSAVDDSKELITRIWFLRDIPGKILQPVDLELWIQGEGIDGSKWRMRVGIYSVFTFH